MVARPKMQDQTLRAGMVVHYPDGGTSRILAVTTADGPEAPEAPVRVTWFATLGADWCEVWRPERRELLQHRIHRLVGFDT